MKKKYGFFMLLIVYSKLTFAMNKQLINDTRSSANISFHSLPSSKDAITSFKQRLDWLRGDVNELVEGYVSLNNEDAEEDVSSENNIFLNDYVDVNDKDRRYNQIERINQESKLLMEDIEAVTQRYPQNYPNLQSKLDQMYRNSFNAKCINAFGTYAAGNEPQKKFYEWVLDKIVKYHPTTTLKDLSYKNLLKLSKSILDDDEVTQEVKNCLREWNTYFNSPFSQVNYDEYLKNNSNLLSINKEEFDSLNAMYHETQNLLISLNS